MRGSKYPKILRQAVELFPSKGRFFWNPQIRKVVFIIPLLLFPLILYLFSINRGFVSEDFPLIRFLSENPPWSSLGELFGRSWLGISIVSFYRPVAILIFGIEVFFFGSSPLGYNIAHIVIHLMNGFLVLMILRRVLAGVGKWVVWGAALLFLLHPLHPNAVLWPASFATLFGATFLLLSVWFFLEYRELNGPFRALASLAAFLLALGCYESAVVLPALLISADILIPRSIRSTNKKASAIPASNTGSVPVQPGFPVSKEKNRNINQRPGSLKNSFLWGLHFVFVLFAFGYLFLRNAVLGSFLGGHSEQTEQLLALKFPLNDLLRSLRLVLIPSYGKPPGLWEVGLILLLLLCPFVLGLFGPGKRRRFWRPALFLWLWTGLSLAPFAFKPPVPANARFIYVSCIGPLVLALLGIESLRQEFQHSHMARGIKRAAGLILAAMALLYAIGLRQQLSTLEEASALAERVVGRFKEVGVAVPGELVAVAGVPAFLLNSSGTNIAQVFHWGLADALAPPFGSFKARVLPLPPGYEACPLPPLPDGRHLRRLRWDPSAERFISVPGMAPVQEIMILDPPEGAERGWLDPELEVHFQVRNSNLSYRVIVLTPGVAQIIEAGTERQEHSMKIPLPRKMLQSMAWLYASPAWWWVEGRDAGGRVVELSRLHELHIHSEPARMRDFYPYVDSGKVN